MPAPLSIIIPTLNAAGQLGPTAACLIEGLDAGVVRDLVISDGGSTDATADIADELGAVWIVGAPGRGGQLARGADAAGGDWLLFLHADTHLSAGWAAVAQQHIMTSNRAGYFRLRFRATGPVPRVFELGVNMRSRLGLPYGDQGLLISKKLYDQIGGFPVIALMEDVAIIRLLHGRLRMLEAFAMTDASKYQNAGWFRRGGRNLWMLLRYLAGADPEWLAKDYYEK